MASKCYACYCLDDAIRNESSSGGIFYCLAKDIIEDGGVVFGAAFDEGFQVFHTYAETLDQLKPLLKCKYVQSRMGNSFKQVKSFLKEGRKVLFCGTPCQTAGLLAFLGKKYDQLILVDFICHGVPSAKVWRHYLQDVAAGRTVTDVKFRDKTNGWSNYSVKYSFGDGSTYFTYWRGDPYMNGFVGDLYLRPSCHACRFKGFERSSDITLGDFWGIKKQLPDMFDDKGTSVVVVHSQKGAAAMKRIGPQLKTRKVTEEMIKARNPMINISAKKHQMRDVFVKSDMIDVRNHIDQIVPYKEETGVGAYLKKAVKKVRKVLKG